MMRTAILTQQGLLNKAHADTKANLQDLLQTSDVRHAPGGQTILPMLVEQDDTMVFTPVGILAFASGGEVARTQDPTVYSIDGGITIPGPAFTERTGWPPEVPFSLQEIAKYATKEADAAFFLAALREAGVTHDGWTSVALLGLSPIDPNAIATLMAMDLRSMYDPATKPPRSLRNEHRRIRKQEKRAPRQLFDPNDWMPQPARRLMRLFTGA